jgi:subtilisin-like proprotein convertase family protein
MSRKASFVFAIAVIANLTLAASASAIDTPASAPLPQFDVRAGDSTDPASAVEKARKRVSARLGSEGIVSSDAVNGGIRSLGASDGLLTDANDDGAQAVALDYVSSHLKVFGLDESDLSALQLAARYTSPDGVTHLTWQQTDRGIPSYDTFLSVNVAADGSIVNVTGSPVHDLSVDSAAPDLTRGGAIDAAESEVGHGSDADPSGLVILADPDGDRLAWRLTVTADDGGMYDEVIDATSGDLLARHSLTEYAGAASVYEYHPGAATGGTATPINLITAGWLAGGATTLDGPFAHAYADVNANNSFAGEEIAPVGADWNFPQVGTTCAAGAHAPSIFTGICTWAGTGTAASATNREQATTQAFYFVNNYHDWLVQAPIGFTNASHNFEVGGTGGDDPVLTEANDGGATNNANMSTPPDGSRPRMQMYLFTDPAVNGDDDGSVVYHEYTHGLSNRLVNNGLGGGLNAQQSRAMGEGWSDWYAMDYLVAHGLETDTAAAGELPLGEYVTNNTNVGIRLNAADCPVGSADATHCPGTSFAGPGGFTFGDMGHTVAYNNNPLAPAFEVHADGEIWLETLWDLRTAVGATTARGLITSAMRVSPANPSFLDMRDAILQADAVAGGANHSQIWSVFANRGMGFSAVTTGANATRGHQEFDAPPIAGLGKVQVADPAPLGDGDGVAEPGETVQLTIPLRNTHGTSVTGVNAELSSTTPGVFVGEPSANYGTIAPEAQANPAAPYAITIPAATSCSTSLALNLAVTSDQGDNTAVASLPLGTPSATTYATSGPIAIPDNSVPGATSVMNIPTAGTIDRMRVSVQVNHTWIGDLHGILTSPSGRSVALFERVGMQSGQFGSPSNNFNVTFDDSAITRMQDSFGGDASAGPTGLIRPDEPLATFDGDNQIGNWTLRVFDVVAGDNGSIQAFSIQSGPPDCSTTVTPPTAATAAASPLTDTGATLNGTINPAGASTDYAFDFGTTTAYDFRTGSASAGSGSTADLRSGAVSGLTPGTPYHYRILALRGGIPVAAGDDATFQTTGTPRTLSIADASKAEGDSGASNADVTVTLSPTSGETVTVHYATSDGTAAQPGDYTATSGSLTFAPGQSTNTISVPVKGDILDENDETVNLDLSAPVAATIGDGHADLTITDDDPPPTISIADASKAEGNSGTSNADFAVTLSAASEKTVTVSYATGDGTATQPGDYSSTSGGLTFAPGETTKTISVPVAGDTADEPDESFSVDLSTPGNTTIAGGHAAGTILDDDEAVVAGPPPDNTQPDKTPPDTKIDSGPTKVKKGKSATFGFSSTEANSHFECKLDNDAFAPCTSPTEIKKPKKGTHTFSVRATDAAGNVDPSAATRDFKVKKKKKKHHH